MEVGDDDPGTDRRIAVLSFSEVTLGKVGNPAAQDNGDAARPENVDAAAFRVGRIPADQLFRARDVRCV